MNFLSSKLTDILGTFYQISIKFLCRAMIIVIATTARSLRNDGATRQRNRRVS